MIGNPDAMAMFEMNRASKWDQRLGFGKDTSRDGLTINIETLVAGVELSLRGNIVTLG